MVYEYSGYLKTILSAQDAAEYETLDSVTLTADDLASWNTKDLESSKEWQRIPVHRSRTPNGVKLSGLFEDVRTIDILSGDDPRYWVPLGSLGWSDSRFPVDLTRYPIIEVTYRCTSDNALPSCMWTYPGGLHLHRLPPSARWQTVARRVSHFGFPRRADALILRLYSPTRTSESFEIQRVRFRAMSPAEVEACRLEAKSLETEMVQKRHEALDTFLPLGVQMDAEVARRLAETLGLTLAEYWRSAFEDVVRHDHNCVALANNLRLSDEEWTEFFDLAGEQGLKVIPIRPVPLGDDLELQREIIETRIRPLANSTTLFAWCLHDEPSEHEFRQLLDVKSLVEEADPKHPTAIISRHPSTFPLYSPFFPISGISHYTSHTPWEVGEIAKVHASLSCDRQFWTVAPAFVYGTGAPEWSSCPEMRLMLALAFAQGARGWLSIMYHNEPFWAGSNYQRSLTGPFLTFSDLWTELGRQTHATDALSPLLLEAKPAPLPRDPFVFWGKPQGKSRLPEGVPPAGFYRLQGPDYSLNVIVNNDTLGITPVDVRIPARVLKGVEIYDLTEFIRHRRWTPMSLERHVEMFPGNTHVAIIGPPSICAGLRDRIAARLVDRDRKRLAMDLSVAMEYGLNVSTVEALEASARSGDIMRNLGNIGQARDTLLNIMYDSPDITRTRSLLTEASAALCACDGVLCRLMAHGKIDLAREWGVKVMPLARERNHFSVEWRQGGGKAVAAHCEELAKRTIQLLGEIRALAPPH